MRHDEAMQERFAEARGAYAEVTRRARDSVVRWEHSAGRASGIEPLWRERGGFAKPRLVAADGAWTHRSGFDTLGRLVVVEEKTSLDGRVYEEVYEYSGDSIVEGIRYGYSDAKEPINVTRLRNMNGRAEVFEIYASAGEGGETYDYDGSGRLTTIHAWHREHGGQREEHLVEVAYDDLGIVRSVENVYPNGYRRSVYKNEPKPRSIKTLAAIVEDELVPAVHRAVARAAVSDPVYCLALAYDADPAAMLPPIVGLGVEVERARWRAERGDAAKELVWNPAEFGRFDTAPLALEGETLLRASESLNRLCGEAGDATAARRTLTRAAARLNADDRPPAVTPTPDFVAYAVDLELADLDKNLKASVPADRLKQLRSEGWL